MTPNDFTEVFIKRALPLPEYGNPGSRWYAANGLCWYWAYVFKKIMGGEIYSYQIKNGSGHCFVKYNGLFYDAETIEGKESWKHLQRYMNFATKERLTKHKSISGFLNTWKLNSDDVIVFEKTVNEIQSTAFMKRF